ncbi:hypothetical protein BHM03_00054774, partial [Ensete ventricosum]
WILGLLRGAGAAGVSKKLGSWRAFWWELRALGGKAPYRPVHTGPVADRYADRPLPVGTAKIGRRLISAVGGRLTEKSIVDGRLKKKKGKEEEEKKKEEEVPGCRPRLRAARALSPSSQLAGDYRPRAGRRNVSLRWERDQGDYAVAFLHQDSAGSMMFCAIVSHL